MLAALWGRVQGWLLMFGASVLVLVGAYVAGGRAAKKSTELDRAKRVADERRQADDMAEKIDAMDDRAVIDAAHRWVRDSTDE